MKKHLMLVTLSMLILLVLVSVSPALAGGKPLKATLDWRNVVPEGSGDPNGWGNATIRVNAGQGEVCYEIRVIFFYSGWPPTGAYIHQGVAGQNGPVVIDLGAPIPPPDSSIATGCLSASSSLLKDIQRNPSTYYLQVTNETHPDGAIRGQLSN